MPCSTLEVGGEQYLMQSLLVPLIVHQITQCAAEEVDLYLHLLEATLTERFKSEILAVRLKHVI